MGFPHPRSDGRVGNLGHRQRNRELRLGHGGLGFNELPIRLPENVASRLYPARGGGCEGYRHV